MRNALGGAPIDPALRRVTAVMVLVILGITVTGVFAVVMAMFSAVPIFTMVMFMLTLMAVSAVVMFVLRRFLVGLCGRRRYPRGAVSGGDSQC